MILTSWISLGISGSVFSNGGGESGKNRGLFANRLEKFSLAIFGYIIGDNEDTMGTTAFGMDDSFRDSFSVKFC